MDRETRLRKKIESFQNLRFLIHSCRGFLYSGKRRPTPNSVRYFSRQRFELLEDFVRIPVILKDSCRDRELLLQLTPRTDAQINSKYI